MTTKQVKDFDVLEERLAHTDLFGPKGSQILNEYAKTYVKVLNISTVEKKGAFAPFLLIANF
jgi:hypothetical protein